MRPLLEVHLYVSVASCWCYKVPTFRCIEQKDISSCKQTCLANSAYGKPLYCVWVYYILHCLPIYFKTTYLNYTSLEKTQKMMRYNSYPCLNMRIYCSDSVISNSSFCKTVALLYYIVQAIFSPDEVSVVHTTHVCNG